MNYSFWADEAYISGIASQLVTGKYSILQAFNALSYQKLYVLVLATFFKLLGISEFTARLPSILIFLIGIIVMFFLAKKLSNVYGGLLSAFLYGFSHLNLAYATQAKPYAAIETILLIILYLLTNKKINHLLIILLCTIATLLHSIGVFIWIVYFVYFVLTLKRWNVGTLFALFLVAIIGSILILPIVLSSIGGGKIFLYNNSYQLIKLFVYKYSFISTCAFFGYVWLFKKHKTLSIAILVYSVVVLFMAGFRAYIFNIRYVLTIFGIIFLYFGIFWAKVGEKYKKNFQFDGRSIIPIIVIIILYTTGYKMVRWPQAYYNPNIDKYGDVQIANYKNFYSRLKKQFPDYKNLYVINDTFDVEYWYFGRYSNAYFMKFTPKPYKHHTANAMIYGSLEDFKKIMKDHPQGLLIMEDWESFLPEDIKQYAKKNLKLEIRVENLKEAPDDPWPLALYSWGSP
ncbi:conserved membrane hypothetical protein [Candidatus Roizmanbacteria bacterium]|nr:conserved membrane hypothetical protein [Candidatus Roizmanbacteria bacterium]